MWLSLVIYTFIGVSEATPEAAAQLLILSRNVLKPEPNERDTYMALTILAPLAIWLSIEALYPMGPLRAFVGVAQPSALDCRDFDRGTSRHHWYWVSHEWRHRRDLDRYDVRGGLSL